MPECAMYEESAFIKTHRLTTNSEPMRDQGKLTQWKAQQGYGFITPIHGGQPVFVHISAFSTQQYPSRHRPTPRLGDVISYRRIKQANGSYKAEDAINLSLPSATPRWSLSTGFARLFMAGMALYTIAGHHAPTLLVWYASASLVTLCAYYVDKRSARLQQTRLPETTLQMLSLLGGWPGGLLGQQLFKHKTQKKAFQRVFWLCVLCNLFVLATLLRVF